MNTNDFIQSVKSDVSEIRKKFNKRFNSSMDDLNDDDLNSLEENNLSEINTGLTDKNGSPIKIGDTVRLILESGGFRDFKVCYKTVRRKIFCHPMFEDQTADVNITGVVFCWNGLDLFPSSNELGESDTERMEIVK